jgi:CHAT domain-containing protein
MILCFGSLGFPADLNTPMLPDEISSPPSQHGSLSEAEQLTRQAEYYIKKPAYPFAIPLLRKALEIREKALGPEHPDTAKSLYNLAKIYRLSGMFAQALPLSQRSLEIREKIFGQNNPEIASSLSQLGFIYSQMGNAAKALPLAQRSLEINEKVLGPENLKTAGSLHILARIYQQMGSYETALPLAQHSVNIKEKVLGLEHRKTAIALRTLGYIYLALKDYSHAEECFNKAKWFRTGKEGMVDLNLAMGKEGEALNILQNIRPFERSGPLAKIQYYTQRGLALKGTGDRQDAALAFLEAIKLIEDLRAQTPGDRTGFFAAGLNSGHFRAYQGMVGVLAEMARSGEPLPPDLKLYGSDTNTASFYFAEAIKARALLETMTAALPKTGQELPADLKEREQRLLQKLSSLESQRAEAFRDSSKRFTSFQAEMFSLQKEFQALVSEVRRNFPRYAALHYPRPYQTRELPLKPGEVLLEYSLGDKVSYLFRVEPGGKTKIFSIPMGQEALEKRIVPLLAPFRQSVLKREDLSRFSLVESASLYKEILSPALAEVPPGTRVVLVPDGILGAFPFEAMVVQSGKDWRDSVFLGDRWPVTYAQSAAILSLNRNLGASKAPSAFFGLGDCIYDKGSPRYQAYKSGKGQAGELRHAGPEDSLTVSATQRDWGQLRFPPLPETRQTVTELTALFQESPKPPLVLLDVLATETKLRQAPLAKCRYLFFGTHGFLADTLTGVRQPVLVLTQLENKPPDDGFLTFSEVMQLKLDADLVTLAACMTGVGKVMQGEGVLNFARAFQQAGARSVMVALWNIPVDESLKFYSTFYKALKEGKTKLEALQTARQAIRTKEPHPYFWSGLILHGEG